MTDIATTDSMHDVKSIIGLKLWLRRTEDQVCRRCLQIQPLVVIKQGASLHCAICGRYRGKLPEKIAAFLGTSVGLFGRPNKTIKIQDLEFVPTPDARSLPAHVDEQHQEEGNRKCHD